MNKTNTTEGTRREAKETLIRKHDEMRDLIM